MELTEQEFNEFVDKYMPHLKGDYAAIKRLCELALDIHEGRLIKVDQPDGSALIYEGPTA